MSIPTMMTHARPTLLAGCLLVLMPFLAASCSEEDGTEEEFVDWKTTNEQYFDTQYKLHASATATSFVVRKWTVSDTLSIPQTDCILVDVIERGEGTVSPYYTDSVCIQYRGRLLPSRSYADGYVFDQSFEGTFDADVLAPYMVSQYSSYSSSTVTYRLPVPSDFVDGFSTALMRMHKGDHWQVTIPYQLAYGETASGVIPAYSTLVFDIWLTDFWTKTKGDRN